MDTVDEDRHLMPEIEGLCQKIRDIIEPGRLRVYSSRCNALDPSVSHRHIRPDFVSSTKPLVQWECYFPT